MNIGPVDEYNRDQGSLTFRTITTNSTNLFDPILHMQYHRSDTNNTDMSEISALLFEHLRNYLRAGN